MFFTFFTFRKKISISTLLRCLCSVCKGVYRNVNICLGFCLLLSGRSGCPSLSLLTMNKGQITKITFSWSWYCTVFLRMATKNQIRARLVSSQILHPSLIASAPAMAGVISPFHIIWAVSGECWMERCRVITSDIINTPSHTQSHGASEPLPLSFFSLKISLGVKINVDVMWITCMQHPLCLWGWDGFIRDTVRQDPSKKACQSPNVI